MTRLKAKVLCELVSRGFEVIGPLLVGKVFEEQIHVVDVQRNIRRRDFVINLGVPYNIGGSQNVTS